MTDVFVVHPDGHTSAERIPGERDPSTLTHREPGSMGGDPYGADIPPVPAQWEDEETCREHERRAVARARAAREDDMPKKLKISGPGRPIF